MIAKASKKTINGREVEYFDVIFHTTTTKFKFWDRIKILFGQEATTSSEIYTQNDCCKVVGSEAKTNVAPLLKRKSFGMKRSIASDEILKNAETKPDEYALLPRGRVSIEHAQPKPDEYTLLSRGWVSIEQAQPKPQQRVYVVCENPKDDGGVVRFQTMAEYIAYMTVKEDDYMANEFHGEGDYNEQEDEYYTPEGFYEWQSEAEMNWKISAKVTHWMPLMELPRTFNL